MCEDNERINELLSIIECTGVELTQLSSDEEEDYKLRWFNTVIPKDKKKAALELNCFGRYDLLGDDWVVWFWGYLWHVFSFGLLECLDGDEARKEFNNIPKHEVILLDSVNREAYRLRNISILLAEQLDELDDIIITDSDFSWTYAKTHESDLGPYFYYTSSISIT